MKLSFICPSNNPEMYRDCILTSLDRQKNRDFELILVDTKKEHYSSGAAALNAGAARATGDYLVFLHHDIVLENEYFIDELISMVDGNDFIIAGVAGAIRGERIWYRKNRSNILHGSLENRIVPGGAPVKEICPLETVDECFFIIPRSVFLQRNFVEYYPSWHLYAVEYCLWAHSQSRKDPVLLFPLRLWHLSRGASMSRDYYSVLRRIRRVYHANIFCTMNAWPNNRILFEARIALTRFRHWKRSFKKKIKRER